MAGFFGLFGGKTKYVDETITDNTDNTDNTDSAVRASDQKENFFLSSDDAKTLGDINFMRQSKTVKKTFAKSKSGGGGELIQEISSLGKVKKSINQASQSISNSSSTPTKKSTPINKTSEEAKERRRSDSSMDMFRNMAKDLRK